MRIYRKRRLRKFMGQSLAVGVMIGAELTRRFIQYARPPKPPAAPRVVIWPKSTATAPYHYIASREGRKYHTPTCRWATQIGDMHRVTFQTSDEAKAAGYEACGTCQPQTATNL